MEQADDTLSDISDFIKTLIKGKEDDLSVKGTELLSNIEIVRAQLGQNDVRSIDFGGCTLTGALEDFASDGNQDVEQNFELIWRLLSKKTKLLKEQFDQDWNCSKEQKNDESGEKVVYKLVTPLKKKEYYVCADCPPTVPAFTNANAYRRHMKKEHDKDVKPDQPKVSCMLQAPSDTASQCRSRLPIAQMYRHFEEAHKLEKKNNRKSHLKYFKSLNGGLTYVEPVFVGADGVQEPDRKYILHDIEEEEGEGGEGGQETTSNEDTGIPASETCPNVPEEEITPEIITANEEQEEKIDSNVMKEENIQSEPPVKKDNIYEDSSIEFKENSLGTQMDDGQNTAMVETSSLALPEPEKGYEDLSLPLGLVISPEKTVEKEGNNKVEFIPGQSKSVEDQRWQDSLVPISDDDSPLKVMIQDDGTEKYHVHDDSASKVHVDDDPVNKVIVDDTAEINMIVDIEDNDASKFMETDSDIDDTDSEAFKSKLLDNRAKRYEERNHETQSDDVATLPENSDFMTEMDTWLKDIKYAANARDAQNIRGKMQGHISNHPHSLLRYEHGKDPLFHLGRYICFTDSSELLELKDPIPWIRSVGGKDGTEQPSKQKELLKCFARLRDFILFKMLSTDFGTGYQDLQRKRDLRQNLLDLEDHIKRSNFSETLDKLINIQAEKKKSVKAQLNPNLSKNEVNAVKTWLTSEEWKEIYNTNIATWEKATAAASTMKANKESRKNSKKRKKLGENCDDKGPEDETVSKRKRRKPMRYQSEDEEEKKVEVGESASDPGRKNGTKTSKSEGKVGCGSSSSDKEGMKSQDSVIKPKETKKLKSKGKIGSGSSNSDKEEMKSTDSVIIKPKDFTAFGAFTQHTLAVKDKNRTSCYSFSNRQFVMGTKLWFPPNFSPDDFDGFPEDWDCTAEPSPARPHDAWQVRLDGSTPGMKGGTGTFVTIEGVALTLVEKYRDLKSLVFGAAEDPDKPFFCNYDGKPLRTLSQNSSGSLWHKFGLVTGTGSATQNSVRRGFESYVQKSKISKKRVKAINNHSDSVGLKFYDGEAGTFRSGVVHTLSQMEGDESNNNNERNSTVMISEEIAEERKKIDAEDEKLRKIIIEETMAKSNEKEKYKLGKTMKVLPSDRRCLQKILTDEKYQHFHGIIKGTRFPGTRKFKKCFYRMVDSEVMELEDRLSIREIERRTFEAIKDIVTKNNNGEWCGSLSQNKRGDQIVAEKIRNSLKFYEQKVESNPSHVSFFTFK